MCGQLDAPRRPSVIFVCMPYGARSAAERLLEAGAPLVVWARASFLEERGAALLCVPSEFHCPRKSIRSAAVAASLNPTCTFPLLSREG